MLSCSAFTIRNELLGHSLSALGESHFVGNYGQSAAELHKATVHKSVFDQPLDCDKHPLFPVRLFEDAVLILSKESSRGCFFYGDENLLVERELSFHMSGLCGFGFEWNQNDITAAPGTYLRPG